LIPGTGEGHRRVPERTYISCSAERDRSARSRGAAVTPLMFAKLMLVGLLGERGT
jgi:hypothetical protein